MTPRIVPGRKHQRRQHEADDQAEPEVGHGLILSVQLPCQP